MSSTNISLKINFQDEIRRILVPSNTDFQALVGKLKSMFNVSELKVQYKDSENDLITISSDEETAEAFRLAQLEVPNVLRLWVAPKQQGPFHPRHPHGPHHGHPHGPFPFPPHPHHGHGSPRFHPRHQQPQPDEPSHFGGRRWGRCGRKPGACPMFGQPEPQDIHFGVVCDGCQQYPLIGIRYKCSDCPDYDLCEPCFNKDVHTENSHAFLKISSRSVGSVAERRSASSAASPAPAEATIAEPGKPEEASAPVVEEPVKSVEPVDIPKEAPEPAAPAAAEPNNRFEQMLSTLADMGFVDRQRNISTLVSHRGNLVAAIQQLLSEL